MQGQGTPSSGVVLPTEIRTEMDAMLKHARDMLDCAARIIDQADEYRQPKAPLRLVVKGQSDA